MRRDESVIVLGEDVGKKGGVFLATDGLWAEFGDERVIDTPLTESMIVGASIGAAVNGLRPVAEIQFADFIFPAFNQLVSEAARMRYRSNNGYAVPMTIRAPYGGGVHGALYHSQSVEAFFTHVPGLKVVIPSTPYDARGLLRSSIRDDDPVLFFEHKKMYRSVRGDVPDTDYVVPLGRAAVTHPGTQITVIAYGLIESPLNFIVDTGASVSVISGSVAKEDGLLPFANEETLRVIGSAGVTNNVPTFKLPKVTFGTHSETDITAVALTSTLLTRRPDSNNPAFSAGTF